jgi:hypothetical protein
VIHRNDRFFVPDHAVTEQPKMDGVLQVDWQPMTALPPDLFEIARRIRASAQEIAGELDAHGRRLESAAAKHGESSWWATANDFLNALEDKLPAPSDVVPMSAPSDYIAGLREWLLMNVPPACTLQRFQEHVFCLLGRHGVTDRAGCAVLSRVLSATYDWD